MMSLMAAWAVAMLMGLPLQQVVGPQLFHRALQLPDVALLTCWQCTRTPTPDLKVEALRLPGDDGPPGFQTPGAARPPAKPHSNRVFKRSPKMAMSLGGRSAVRMICFLASYRVLKVWKNSSSVEGLAGDKLDVVHQDRSALRYLLRGRPGVVPWAMAAMISLVKSSLLA